MAGPINFVTQLANGLTKMGHEVFVIAPSKTFKDTVTREGNITVFGIRSVVIPRIIYPSQLRLPITAGSSSIRKIIKEVKPDIINIEDHFMIGSKVAEEGKKLKIPLVGTNHFMPENFIHYLYPPEFAKEIVKKLAWQTFLRVYKKMDVITVPTKTAASLIKDLGLKNSIIPISNGVDLDRFNPNNKGNYLRRYLKIPASDKIALFVGRLDKEKHIEVLIKAFTYIPPQSHIKLVITGKGKEKPNLIKLAKRLKVNRNIIFTGFVPEENLPYLYGMADLFVIASIAELQSIATMEAMASGLPVVAAKAIALPELVHDGKNGYLFNQEDSETLANQMMKILKNPSLRKRMSENSLRIIQYHNLKNTIKSYEKVYKKLVSASGNRS